MAEQTSTTNLQRPPIYRVAAGRQLKGATVEILGTTDQKPLNALRPSDQVWVREFTQYPRPEQKLREATIGWRNLERTFRTKDEEALGRDFTDEEAEEYDRVIRLKVAQHQAQYRAKSINDRLAQMAERLERAAEDMRRLATSEHHTLDQKVYQVQHNLAWLFPNLGTDSLTLAPDGRRDQAARRFERRGHRKMNDWARATSDRERSRLIWEAERELTRRRFQGVYARWQRGEAADEELDKASEEIARSIAES